MPIRLRVIIIIAFTNLCIIVFSMFAGTVFMNQNIDEAQEADMQIVADMADNYLSNEIELLFLKVTDTAKDLVAAEQSQWTEILLRMQLENPEFIGAAVFDINRDSAEVIREGEKPAPVSALETTHIMQAFEGKKTLGTSYFYDEDTGSSINPGDSALNPDADPDGAVFYAAVPFPGSQNMLLCATIPGLFFHEMLIDFVIWETGHVFMIDTEGTLVSNPRRHWVYQRCNIQDFAVADPGFTALAQTAAIMASGEAGIGYYTVYDIPRVCAYKPVAGSQDGWSLGTVAPLPESPFRNVDTGLFIIGSIGFIMGVVAAIIAATFIKKPFEKVEALKAESELNSQYKSQFLANMSHEMRTPLTSVIGLTELTLRTVHLDEETHGNLLKVYRAGETLLGLINDILDISKIEANKFELNPNEYDLPSTLNDSITQSLLYVGEKPVELLLDIPEDLPRSLYGDELRIKQVFNNLLSNAFKFTKEGTVKFSVRCENEGDAVWMTATVADTGIGIKPEDFDKLFTLYAHMDSASKIYDSTRRIEGTGLGLSICKRIVEMMDGTISVESEYGKGSTFTVRVKQKHVDSTVIGTDVVESLKNFHYSIDKFKTTETSRINLSYARVLVVDDNTANLDVAKGLMSLYGMKIDCVTGGRAAIDAIEEQKVRYNAIFMDHMMPEIDGIEATRLIREIDTRYAKQIPIIALTANAVIGNEEMFLKKGFQAFLAKPIDMTELDTVLKKWVRDKDAESLGGAETVLPEIRTADGTDAGIQNVRNKTDAELSIRGINVENMKQRYQNEPGIYLPVLRSFAENAAVLIEKLREVSEDNIDNYCIDIHGLKGISSNISADEITKEAAELEKLAKTGDIDELVKRNNDLLKKVTALLSDLQAWFGGYESSSGRTVLKAPDPEVLKRLRECCEKFDIEGADKAIEELESAQYETGGELIGWLREKITDSRFGEIVKRLGQE